MRIRPDQRQKLSEIAREELELATRRIEARVVEIELRPAASRGDGLEQIRKFYEDLTDNPWTEGDETCLNGLESADSAELRRTLRETFRRSPINPPPSFEFLINLKKREASAAPFLRVPEEPGAMSAAHRERLANLLEGELEKAASELIGRLKLGEDKAAVVRDALDRASGQVIASLSPLT